MASSRPGIPRVSYTQIVFRRLNVGALHEIFCKARFGLWSLLVVMAGLGLSLAMFAQPVFEAREERR